MRTRAPEFSAWLDEFFASYYRHRPVNATFIGVHEHDHRLPDLSEAGAGDALADAEVLLASLDRLPLESLSPAQELDRTLARGFLEIQHWEFTSYHFHRGNPSFYVGEAVFGVIALFLTPFAPWERRLESAISRLEAVPALLRQARQNVREAPPAWTERAIRECIGTLALLGRGIDRLIAEHGLDGNRLRAAANQAAKAFADFQDYLTSDLRGRTTNRYAAGEGAFNLMLRHAHFLDIDAHEIDAYASEQLEAAEAALDVQASAFEASGWRDAITQLADLHPSPVDYYRRYTEIWEAHRAAATSHNLLTWPDYPIRFVPRPVWSRDAAPYLYFLFYRSPAPYDHLPVTNYLVNPIEPEMPAEEQQRFLRATNDSVIKINHVVHHGGIGHHVQNWHAFRATSRIGQMAGVDCASRIAMLCGGTMTEGWACYATGLMDEIGFLTPLERYSEHHSRMRMAARSIVDIRLHTGRFSLDDAVAFYRDRVGMPQEAAHGEAVKNSMFPGGAMMYLIGLDSIRDLRRAMETRQGADFTLRDFHDRFLSFGSVPVSLISRSMLADSEGDGS